MGKKEKIEEKAWTILSGLCAELSLIPVDAEYVKKDEEYSLLLYVDKEGGVTIDDCEALSRRMDPVLDEENFITDPYTMIVSSPGLGRSIKRPRDFIFARGKEIDLKTYKAIDGSKEFCGILKEFDDTSVTITDGDREQTFLRTEIAGIKLTVHF